MYCNKAGLATTTPMDLMHAHEHKMGVGWIPWADEVGIQRAALLLQVLNSNCVTSELVKVMLPEIAKLAGREGVALTGDPGHKVECWIWQAWKWINKHNLEISTVASIKQPENTLSEASDRLCTHPLMSHMVLEGCRQTGVRFLWEVFDKQGKMRCWTRNRHSTATQKWLKAIQDALTTHNGSIKDALKDGRSHLIPESWCRPGVAVTDGNPDQWVGIIRALEGVEAKVEIFRNKNGNIPLLDQFSCRRSPRFKQKITYLYEYAELK
jgi:hypothetical protein